MKAKALNKKATAIMDEITAGLKVGEAKKIHNDKSYMAVNVDYLGHNEFGDIFAVSHYYKQNGDMMADPDMTFLKNIDKYYPMTYQQDNLGLYQEAIWFPEGGAKIKPELQNELAKFANTWMANIKHQQLEVRK